MKRKRKYSSCDIEIIAKENRRRARALEERSWRLALAAPCTAKRSRHVSGDMIIEYRGHVPCGFAAHDVMRGTC